MATIVRMQNQTFPFPSELAALVDESEAARRERDSMLKRWLSQVSPAATNARLEWSEENGDTVVKVSPQLGTKGGLVVDPLSDALRDAPPYVPGSFSLVATLKMRLASGELTLSSLLAAQERVATVLEEGYIEERLVGHCFRHLKEAKALPSPLAPTGF